MTVSPMANELATRPEWISVVLLTMVTPPGLKVAHLAMWPRTQGHVHSAQSREHGQRQAGRREDVLMCRPTPQTVQTVAD